MKSNCSILCFVFILFISTTDGLLCNENCDISGCNNSTGICSSCKDGWYGNSCNQTCSDACKWNKCDTTSGSCVEGCKIGWFGEFCNSSCDTHCNTCNSTDGKCISCTFGYWGMQCEYQCHENCQSCDMGNGDCDVCKSTYWGQNCTESCSTNCMVCDTNTKACQFCKHGFWDTNCTKQCGHCQLGMCDRSTGRCYVGCKDGWFGQYCDQPCMSNCSRCSNNETCDSCVEGLGGDDCSVTCPENCDSCSLGRYCDASCKEGFQVPSYNCTCSNAKCTKYGYHETYNDTVCKECETGTGWFNIFGTCCPCLHCKGGINQCSPSGKCLQGCEPGYYKDFYGCSEWCDIPHCIWCEERHAQTPLLSCSGCDEGWFISNHTCAQCNEKCSLNVCNNHTGICTYGCDQGWYGDVCNLPCAQDCAKCNRTDGKCLLCKLGKWGSTCTETCPSNCTACDVDSGDCLFCNLGSYGDNCSETCENCKQSFCQPDNGKCYFGCKNGWFGEKCNQNCLPHCASCQDNSTCSYCETGWGGDLCDVECPDTCTRCSLGKYCSECKDENKVPSFNCTCNDAKCTRYQSKDNATVCAECETGTGWFNLFDTCCPCLHCLGGTSKCSSHGRCEDGCEPGWYLAAFGCVERCDIPNCVWCTQRNDLQAGVSCIGCEDGWYVDNDGCKMCSANCAGNDSMCNNKTGHCLQGCNRGWRGDKCDVPCDDMCLECDNASAICNSCKPGTWGNLCQNDCPTSCQSCNASFGNCTSCASNTYGNLCENECSHHCNLNPNSSDPVCDFFSGHCNHGCQVGWYGYMCDKQCSANCQGKQCSHETGHCLTKCSNNLPGEPCTTGCGNSITWSLIWCMLNLILLRGIKAQMEA